MGVKAGAEHPFANLLFRGAEVESGIDLGTRELGAFRALS